MESIVLKLQEVAAFYGLKIVAALVILVLGRIVAGTLRRLLRKAMTHGGVEPTLIAFVSSLVYMGVMAIVLIAALGKLGVQTTSFIAVIGAAGLAIGLAFQGTLSNLAAGVLLIVFSPFRLKDFIEAGGTSGFVQEIGVFSTVVKSVDNKKIILPNAQVIGGVIINHTAEDIRRVDIIAGVGYGENLDVVRKTLEEILAGEALVLKDPAPMIVVAELAESSVNIAVRPWVKTSDYWTVWFSVHEAIKKGFDAKGISIPFPQRDLHLEMPEKMLHLLNHRGPENLS